jgi:hypothetical protein
MRGISGRDSRRVMLRFSCAQMPKGDIPPNLARIHGWSEIGFNFLFQSCKKGASTSSSDHFLFPSMQSSIISFLVTSSETISEHKSF